MPHFVNVRRILKPSGKLVLGDILQPACRHGPGRDGAAVASACVTAS